MEQFSRHRCLIYDGAPSVHLSTVAGAAIEHLQANYRCLYLNSPNMVAGLRLKLAGSGVDVAEATARGSLVLSSDQDHLVDEEFDVQRMLTKLRDAVGEALAAGYVGLWASGDMLWEFGSERNLGKLLEYELGLEALLKSQPALSGICQYHRETLPLSALRVALYTHASVYVNETLTRVNPHFLRPATLQHGARLPLLGAHE